MSKKAFTLQTETLIAKRLREQATMRLMHERPIGGFTPKLAPQDEALIEAIAKELAKLWAALAGIPGAAGADPE